MRNVIAIAAIVVGVLAMMTLPAAVWTWVKFGLDDVQPESYLIFPALFLVGALAVFAGWRVALAQHRPESLLVGAIAGFVLAGGANLAAQGPQFLIVRVTQTGWAPGPVAVAAGASAARAPNKPRTAWLVLRVRSEVLTVQCPGRPDHEVAYLTGAWPSSGDLVLNGCGAVRYLEG